MSKAKTRVEIAVEYGIHRKTLARWLEREKIILPPGLVNPKNQQLIYDTFGQPKGLAQQSKDPKKKPQDKNEVGTRQNVP